MAPTPTNKNRRSITVLLSSKNGSGAIRFLDSAEDQALRQQTEALFQVAAIHTQLGQLNPRLTWELKRAVNDLRSRLQERNDRRPLPWADYQEAQRFLNRLAKAPELLAQVLPTPSGS